MKSFVVKTGAWALSFGLPVAAFAAITDIPGVFDFANGLLNILSSFFIALAVIFFLYGVVKFVFAADDEEKRKDGRSMMFYGIVAIAVMVSVWALVNILTNTIGTPGTPLPGPKLPR